MTTEELQSQTIRWLRFPLAVAVVYTHAILPEELQIDLWQTNYKALSGWDVINIIRVFFTEVFVRVARPCFFMISGFLFYSKIEKWGKQVYIDKIKRRIKTLLIPYLLWNLIAVIIAAFFLFIRNDSSLVTFWNDLWNNGILKVFWNYRSNSYGVTQFGFHLQFYYPYNAPLWFIRDLIMMVFLSPAIYYFLKYTKIIGIIILGIFFSTEIWIYTPGFSINAFFFFGLGAYFSIHGKNMIIELRKRTILWLLLATVSLILSIYNQSVFFQLYIIFGSITIINIASYVLECGRLSTVNKYILSLSKTSFFIFATHIIFLYYSSKLINIIIRSDSVFFLMVKYLTAPIFYVGICVGLYYVVNKIAPKVLKVLTGSR